MPLKATFKLMQGSSLVLVWLLQISLRIGVRQLAGEQV